MKRSHVITFRVPAERRVKALFRDEPDVWADFEGISAQLLAVLGVLYRRSPNRAFEVVRRITTLVVSELEQAVQPCGEGDE
jgi:hypothetical protein